MTEAQQIEFLQSENATLRQRIEQLEQERPAAAAPPLSAPGDSAVECSQRFAQLFAQAPVYIFETTLDLRTRMWNPTAARVFGYKTSEILGENPYTVLWPHRDPAEVARSSAEMHAHGWTRSVGVATAKDGRQIHTSCLTTYLNNEAGQVTGIGWFGRDITAERAIELARRESEALFGATFETAGVGLCVLDDRGHFIRVNSAYCKMYGWSSAELIGQHFTFVVPPDLRDRMNKGYQKMVQSSAGGPTPEFEASILRRDGSPLNVASTFSLISLEDGRRIQVWAITDITERKIRSAELQQRMQDAERETAEKTRLLAELDQKLEVIARQHQQILDLSAPVLDIWDGVLLLPLIGRFDGRRVSVVTELLLQAVVARRTRQVILDLTSLEMLDTANAGYISTMVQALRLLGVRSVITGIRAPAAQAMVRMGVDLQGVMTVRDLQQGLRACVEVAVGASLAGSRP